MITGDLYCGTCGFVLESNSIFKNGRFHHPHCFNSEHYEEHKIQPYPLIPSLEKKIENLFNFETKLSYTPTKWDKYFLNIVLEVSKLSNCPRKSVGSVIVNEDNNIISTGFNGSISKSIKTCDSHGCIIKNNHCQRVIHSELNSILQCAKLGKSCKNCRIYVSLFPCLNCFKAIAQVGINKVLYLEDYKNDELVYEFAKEKGIEIIKLEMNNNV